ncbi:MAG TPA: urease accessory protein UreE [Candidatus Scatomonas merdavium]|nr:urease accessory protein UreE [Candidatus Scatomonas merdavium]
MICEKILGMLDELDVAGKTVEYVEIEWHEAFKKIHKKTTDTGREVGIRMDDSVLTEGLYDGKVIYMDDGLVIAVHTPPCEVIRVTVKPDHRFMAAKVCYEIGNRHAPLFYGEDEYTFITPYNEPMLQMLSGLHGVEAEKEMRKLAFDKRVSASVHNHHH